MARRTEYEDRWLSPTETARFLGIAVKSVYQEQVKQLLKLPPRYMLGPRTPRYRLSELVAWAEARREGGSPPQNGNHVPPPPEQSIPDDWLTCRECDDRFPRPQRRGRPPSRCPKCRAEP